MSLWSDIKGLSKGEFSAVLDEFAVHAPPPAPKKASARSKSRKAKFDTPAARIVGLASDKGLANRDVQIGLVKVLVERGYSASDIPNALGKRLEDWLNELMRSVPSSEVMEAATKLIPQD